MAASMAGGTVFPPAVAAATGGSGSASAGADANGGMPGADSSKVVLEFGSQGGLVAAAQRRLNEILPFSHLAVDGIYGPLTRAAVRDFQRRDGLLADGMIDADTWAKMFNAPVLVFGAAADAGGSARPSSGATAPTSHSQFVSTRQTARAPRAIHVRADKVATSTGAPSGARGGSLVAGGPGGTAQPAPPATPVSTPAPAGGTAGSSGGGTTVSVVAPTAPTTQPSTYVLTDGVALPLPRQYITGGYVDQGVDYAAPGGTPEYAMGDGVIIGEGIAGFGPNAPILKITSGPLAGLEVYYGHAGTNVVRVGDHVRAGQQISEVGYGIVGISTGPHLEIGFYPPGGMGAGSKMLSVINALLKQHPSGRTWASPTNTTTAHVARDTATRTTPSTSGASSSTGGAAVVLPATPAAPAAAPAPVAAPSPAAAAPSTPIVPSQAGPSSTSTASAASIATPAPASPSPSAPVSAPATAPATSAAAGPTPAASADASTTPPTAPVAPAPPPPSDASSTAPTPVSAPAPSDATPVSAAPAAPSTALPATDAATPAPPAAPVTASTQSDASTPTAGGATAQ
jgi:murein DD-endopeptidase MepM/ murein hydrolase activator NlpD